MKKFYHFNKIKSIDKIKPETPYYCGKVYTTAKVYLIDKNRKYKVKEKGIDNEGYIGVALL